MSDVDEGWFAAVVRMVSKQESVSSWTFAGGARSDDPSHEQITGVLGPC